MDPIVHKCFQWEINQKRLNGLFWGPIPDDLNWKELDPNTKIGWRGPAIKKSNAKNLPQKVNHYDTWWDDYMSFRTHDFLNIKRDK